MSEKVLFWDFDGTLGYRRGGMWSNALFQALIEKEPNCTITQEHFSPFLKIGFPWHEHEVTHTELNTSELWWSKLKKSVIIKAYVNLGYGEERAIELADLAHKKYTDINYWSLFDDVIPTLKILSTYGWQHVIVSNHVPELSYIVDSLGLSEYITQIINSAVVGYEKPHSQIYKIALKSMGYPQNVWMIGDNVDADVLGAEAVGIKGILVRKENSKAIRQCKDFTDVIKIIQEQSN
jgi:putative hydrolase of the HAD superfamily